MHRSRLPVFVILAAAAACSTRDDSQGTELLSQDSTLAARLEIVNGARQLTLPDACGAVTVAAQPIVANKTQAEELTRQASNAEILGNVKEARSLLRRASDLDSTNKSAAYHLGLTSEALGDSSAAMTAYCRFLALTPTPSEALEARQRVAKLSPPRTQVAAGSVSETAGVHKSAPVATAHREPRERKSVRSRVAERTTVAQASARPAERAASSTRIPAGRSSESSASNESPTSNDAVKASPSASGPSEATSTGDVAVMTSRPAPDVDQSPTATSTSSRRPSRAQGAIIGVATGAVIGGVTGRSVKGAVIGAAAGGVLGTVVGRGIIPAGHSIAQ